jgi:hypothetical protein
MARPSSLTDKQKQEILRLSLAGESPYVIAQRTGIPESTVRRNVSAVSTTIKSAANQIVSGEEKIAALPVPAQIIATEYAASLRAMRAELGKAAAIGAKNAARMHALAALALDQASEDPGAIDTESLKVAAGVTKAGNDAAAIALDLMRINKDSGQDDPPEDHKPPAMIQLVGPGG